MIASSGFDSGKHYWEIRVGLLNLLFQLDTFVELEDIYVGISKRGINLYARPLENMQMWGYIVAAYYIVLIVQWKEI